MIRGFCKLIEHLPKTAREVWKQAKQREFNIGAEAAMPPKFCEFLLPTETVKAAEGFLSVSVTLAR